MEMKDFLKMRNVDKTLKNGRINEIMGGLVLQLGVEEKMQNSQKRRLKKGELEK